MVDIGLPIASVAPMRLAFVIRGTADLTPDEARQVRASKDKATLLRTWGYRFESWVGETPFIEHRERAIGATVAIVEDEKPVEVEVMA